MLFLEMFCGYKQSLLSWFILPGFIHSDVC